jgi:hypothetical protein
MNFNLFGRWKRVARLRSVRLDLEKIPPITVEYFAFWGNTEFLDGFEARSQNCE